MFTKVCFLDYFFSTTKVIGEVNNYPHYQLVTFRVSNILTQIFRLEHVGHFFYIVCICSWSSSPQIIIILPRRTFLAGHVIIYSPWPLQNHGYFADNTLDRRWLLASLSATSSFGYLNLLVSERGWQKSRFLLRASQ